MSDTTLKSAIGYGASIRFTAIRAGLMWLSEWIVRERRGAIARRVAAAVKDLQHPGVMADFESACRTGSIVPTRTSGAG